MWTIAIILLAAIGVMGDAFIKSASAGPLFSPKFLLGLLLYSATAFGWFFVMRNVKLSSLGGIYGVSTVLLLVLVGAVFFEEHIAVGEWVGIFLAITSILLLARFS